MAKFTTAQNNFISGELSPRLEGRGDIQEYYNGVALMENAIPARSGGAFKRPGSQFVEDITGTLQEVGALYPLTISRKEAYLIALTTKVPAIPSSSIDVKVYRVGFSGKQTLTLKTTNNGYPLLPIIGTPYSDKKFNFVQIFDLLIFTHTSGIYEPFVVRKLSDGTFQVNTYFDEVAKLGNIVRGRVYPEHNTVTANTITISGAGTIATLSSSFETFAVGETFKVRASATLEYAYRVVVDVGGGVYTVVSLLSATADGVYTAWAKQSWSRASGFPKAVSLYQQRLAFGGTEKDPTGTWYTNIENLFLILNKKLLQDSATDVSGIDFFGPILTSDPFGVTLTADQSDRIKWMASDKVLQVGTDSTEHVVSTVDGKFGPSNVNVSAQTFFGSNDSAAIRAQNATVFVSSDGKSLREISFSFENGSNVSRLLSLLSEDMVYHNSDPDTGSIFDIEIEQMVYQASRSCVWMLTSIGELIGLVIEESGKVLAWHRHTLSGTDTRIWGMTVLPDVTGRYDNLYLNVERTIDGSTAAYIEVIGPDFNNDKMYGHGNSDLRNFPIYTDSFFTPTTFSHGATKADIPHLAGEQVEVLEKGVYKGLKTVKTDLGGSPYIDISAGLVANDIIVGLPYKAKIKSLKIQKGSQTGTSEIQLKRIDTLIVTLRQSLKYRIGTRPDNTELVDKSVTDKVQLFTGEHRTSPGSTSDTDQRFYIESEGPYPFNVLSVGSRGLTED